MLGACARERVSNYERGQEQRDSECLAGPHVYPNDRRCLCRLSFKDARDLLLRPENFLGKNISEVLPVHLADEFLQCFKRTAECDDPIVHEYTLPVNDETRHYEARMIHYL